MNGISEIVQKLIVGSSKRSGRWMSMNAVCCPHNGSHRLDTKGRGGFIFEPDGSFGYSCFNCGYKTRYQPGSYLSSKMTDLMKWCGASDTDIMRSKIIASELLDDEQLNSLPQKVKVNTLQPHDLPKNAAPFSYWINQTSPPDDFIKVLMSVNNRNETLLELDNLWWSPESSNEINKRFIIPFYYQHELYGYTARHIEENHFKRFFNQYEDSLLFNFDVLNDDRDNIILHEGPLDAMITKGIAICGHSIKNTHIELLNNSGKNIIVCPDRDKDGKRLVYAALANNWKVSFPDWGYIEDDKERRLIKDTEEATKVYGRAFTVYQIYNSIKSTNLQIQQEMYRWFKE